jgi:orotidine-5'-phosphate decarboxylase
MSDADMAEAGFRDGVEATVMRRAAQAVAAGADGIVCSPREAPLLRGLVPASTLLVTPGIRPAGGADADQKRVTTPAEAIAAGADLLVVGRPILAAADRHAAAEAIVAQIAAADAPASG